MQAWWRMLIYPNGKIHIPREDIHPVFCICPCFNFLRWISTCSQCHIHMISRHWSPVQWWDFLYFVMFPAKHAKGHKACRNEFLWVNNRGCLWRHPELWNYCGAEPGPCNWPICKRRLLLLLPWRSFPAPGRQGRHSPLLGWLSHMDSW